MNETWFQPRLTEIDDELKDLQTGNPFFPPNADAAGALEVVPVHNNMYQQVEDDGHPWNGGEPYELSVA